jgi:myosin-18
LIFGANQLLRNELHLGDSILTLDASDTGNLLFQSASDLNQPQTMDNELNSFWLNNTIESFKVLNFEEAEIRSIFNILGALIHLGRAGAVKLQHHPTATAASSSQRIGQFKSANEAHLAANLLGVSFNQLNDYVFTLLNNQQQSGSGSTNRTKYGHLSNHGSSRVSPDSSGFLSANLTPQDCLLGFCIGLYQECLNLIVNCINRSFKPATNQPISNSMLILDPPGFRSNNNRGGETGGAGGGSLSYSDLICNYLSERLQLMFYQINFINPIEKCAQEGLDVDLVEHIPESPSALVNWFDKPPPPPASMLHRNNFNLASQFEATSQQHQSQPHHHHNQHSQTTLPVNYGLLWLLEEQMYSDVKPHAVLKRLADSDPKQNFITLNHHNNTFTIYHQFGQFAADYNLDTWFELYNKDFVTQRNAPLLLQNSKKDFIASAFLASMAMSNAAASINNTINMNSSASTVSSAMGGDNASTTGGHMAAASLNLTSSTANSLKRQASVRKMLTLSKRKTFSINLKLQIDSVFDSLRKTKSNFLFCLLAAAEQMHTSPDDDNERTDVPLMRSQLRAYQLLAACRIYRQGYPEYLNFEEFERRFSMFLNNSSELSSHTSLNTSDIHRQACLSIIKSLDLDSSVYKMGNTQVCGGVYYFKLGKIKLFDS